ncbi:CoA pyrophosphatase [Defluviimonas aestuarii]|uniref:CoA pyrophosphatase n=1 Tax=Albidovulum aestuarii TaxID=1130726 RepID=UPI00249A4F4B|nr:CoA pyrophosphatase [Defluviimonas aestuarii]MDI3337779.1 CoA pyrophosphatase [Defluviimonas aestuarii]
MKADPIAAIRQALTRPGRETSDYDLNPDTVLPEGRVLKPAAVLVPLTTGPNGPQVILTKRSSRLKHHPGQIAFPGGKIDETDAGPVDAALREAEEEIGLPRQNVDILGTWSAHETVTGFMVTPAFGLIRDGFSPAPEAGEVDEVFSVPLSHVTDLVRFRIEGRIWRGVRRRYYVVPYGPYYIWGATARILRALADRMAE